MLRPFIHQIRPFRRVDFSNPNIRQGMHSLFAGLNLDDPATQHLLRELTIPISLFDQLARVGQAAYQAASQLTGPTLIIQGVDDEVVLQKHTRHLLRQMPESAQYLEVAAGHNLIVPGQPGWPQVERAVLDFTCRFLA